MVTTFDHDSQNHNSSCLRMLCWVYNCLSFLLTTCKYMLWKRSLGFLHLSLQYLVTRPAYHLLTADWLQRRGERPNLVLSHGGTWGPATGGPSKASPTQILLHILFSSSGELLQQYVDYKKFIDIFGGWSTLLFVWMTWTWNNMNGFVSCINCIKCGYNCTLNHAFKVEICLNTVFAYMILVLNAIHLPLKL